MTTTFTKHAMALAAGLAVLSTGGQAQEREVTIEREGLAAPLAGSLAGEAGSTDPGIVIIPGSGPTDRDGNSPLGVNASSYRLLAEGLAQSGIPSLRIDKRGMFASSAAIADANQVTIADYAGDALAWAARLRAETGADCAWLLGHSEGGLVALRAATTDPSGLCGVILAAAPGRPLGTVLRQQLAAAPAMAPLLEEAERHIATLEAGRRIEGPIHPGLAPLFAPAVQDFLISLFAQDPAALAATLDLPVLIQHGREDLQVADADAEALAAARPEARLAMLDGVNHLLKTVPEGDRAANLASYADPDLPLAEGAVAAITDFVTENAPDQ